MLQTARGPQGGYRLRKPPEAYSVGEILRAAEGSLAPVACLEHRPNQCPRCDECMTLPVWEGLEKVISEYLDGLSLKDILDRKADAVGNDYII